MVVSIVVAPGGSGEQVYCVRAEMNVASLDSQKDVGVGGQEKDKSNSEEIFPIETSK